MKSRSHTRAATPPRAADRRPRAGRGHRRPIGWWIAGLVAVVGIGFFYFGAVRPYDSSTDAPVAPATGGERPADPRITLLTGQAAPDFILPSAGSEGMMSLAALRASGNVLLYFQEGIMCPPCWQQMRDFKRDGEKLSALGVRLVTITVDPIDQLRATIPREQIEGMTLLVDTDLRVSRTYQMLYTGMMGGTRPGHSFVLVGKDGKILWRRDFKEMYVPNEQVLEPVAKALGRL